MHLSSQSETCEPPKEPESEIPPHQIDQVADNRATKKVCDVCWQKGGIYQRIERTCHIRKSSINPTGNCEDCGNPAMILIEFIHNNESLKNGAT